MSDNNPAFSITESSDHFARFRWTIDISSIQYSGSLHDIGRDEQLNRSLEIDSEKFSILPYESLEWHINLQNVCSYGTIRVGSDHYFYEIESTVALKEDRTDGKNLKATLCYNILDNDCIMYTKNSILNCSYSKSGSVIQQTQLLCPVYSNNSLLFFRDGLMVIEGHITLQEDCCKTIERVELENLRHLQQDLNSALKNKELMDVHLEVAGSVIDAHNVILSSRSPVFRKMFETEMVENSTNSVKIPDLERPILEAFILFLYTGSIEDHTFDTVSSLYYAADKYEVKSLQDTCRELLVACLSVDTVLYVLKLSDMHNDKPLRDTATNFICDNFRKIFVTDQWKSFIDTSPYLASYLLTNISMSLVKI